MPTLFAEILLSIMIWNRYEGNFDSFSRVQKIKLYCRCVSFFKPSEPVIPLFSFILENQFGHHTKIDTLLFSSGWLWLKLFLLFSYLLSTFWLFTNQFSVIYLFTQSIISYLCCDNQMLAIYVSNYDATSTCQTTSKTIYKIIKIQFWNPHKLMFARFAFLLNY